MQPAEHTEAVRREGEALLAAARAAGLGAGVPGCPAWTVRDLLAHTGFVHRWATRYLVEAPAEMLDEPDEVAILAAAPPDDEIFGWFAEGHARLVLALASAPADLTCWTFLPAPTPLAFWARRQAHETAIHRVDAEQALGARTTPVDAAFAADGIEEIFLFARRNHARRNLLVVEDVVALRATDLDRHWQVPLSANDAEAEEGSVEVQGRAEELYLMLWNRLHATDLTVTGNLGPLARSARSLRIRW